MQQIRFVYLYLLTMKRWGKFKWAYKTFVQSIFSNNYLHKSNNNLMINHVTIEIHETYLTVGRSLTLAVISTASEFLFSTSWRRSQSSFFCPKSAWNRGVRKNRCTYSQIPLTNEIVRRPRRGKKLIKLRKTKLHEAAVTNLALTKKMKKKKEKKAA